MFYGYKPQQEILNKCKITKSDFLKCRSDNGKCRGQLPVGDKIMFVYLDDNEIDGDYAKALSSRARYDDGVIVIKYTASYKDDTYCWIKEKSQTD